MLVGVDVGASHIEAAISFDAAHPATREMHAGLTIKPENVARAADHISGIIEATLRVNHPGTPVRSIVVGSTGMHTEGLRSAMENRLRQKFTNSPVHITTDGAIALESAFGDCPGIVVCAGSGTIAYSRDPDGTVHRVGGLGPILADEGSGFDIGIAGMRAAARAADGRPQSTSLMSAILTAVGASSLDGLIDWAWKADRTAIAALAEVVCGHATSGDAVAQSIVDTAAEELGQLAIALTDHFENEQPISVAFSGGVLSLESPVRTALRAILAEKVPNVCVLNAPVDPVLGALSMADRLGAS